MVNGHWLMVWAFVILSDFFEEKIVSKDYKSDYFNFNEFVILSDFHLHAGENFIEG